VIGDAIARLGERSLAAIESLGRVAQFGSLAVRATTRGSLRTRRLIDEVYATGVLSLSIITVSGVAVGMVLGLNGYHTLIRYGAEENLGAIVAITLIRELGPVLTALLLAGRAGSAAAGEIGSMVATEQIDGLRMMAIDPVDFVVWPKLSAFLIATPLLSGLFIACGLCGGYLAGVGILGVDAGSYMAGIESSISFADEVAMSLVKALVFGVLVGLIATYHGYTAEPNVAGVSRATTASVVAASVSVLISDYVITALWEA
jgi:phospholipid/cholesterol/gamma-HCH transport system permease protein